jgi:hypothetical protein
MERRRRGSATFTIEEWKETWRKRLPLLTRTHMGIHMRVGTNLLRCLIERNCIAADGDSSRPELSTAIHPPHRDLHGHLCRYVSHKASVPISSDRSTSQLINDLPTWSEARFHPAFRLRTGLKAESRRDQCRKFLIPATSKGGALRERY